LGVGDAVSGASWLPDEFICAKIAAVSVVVPIGCGSIADEAVGDEPCCGVGIGDEATSDAGTGTGSAVESITRGADVSGASVTAVRVLGNAATSCNEEAVASLGATIILLPS
jgi:hypothetical protein